MGDETDDKVNSIIGGTVSVSPDANLGINEGDSAELLDPQDPAGENAGAVRVSPGAKVGRNEIDDHPTGFPKGFRDNPFEKPSPKPSPTNTRFRDEATIEDGDV
jgi:hypothetical protein